jgi:hypothetical protein
MSDEQGGEIAVPDGTVVYKTGKIELGISDEGNGYITFETVNGESYTVSVARDDITEFVTSRSESHPTPTPPEDTLDAVTAPRDWTAGNVVHTGGGIWCRIWRKEISRGCLEVIYDPTELTGVDLGLYGPGDAWLGRLDSVSLEPTATEEDAVQAANSLMDAVDDGKFKEEIEQKLS